MIQVEQFEWHPGSELPECSLVHLGIETSHEVIAIVEENRYRSTLVLQYHRQEGWQYANGVGLDKVFPDAKVLQWAFTPRPVQWWQESEEDE